MPPVWPLTSRAVDTVILVDSQVALELGRCWATARLTQGSERDAHGVAYPRVPARFTDVAREGLVAQDWVM